MRRKSTIYEKLKPAHYAVLERASLHLDVEEEVLANVLTHSKDFFKLLDEFTHKDGTNFVAFQSGEAPESESAIITVPNRSQDARLVVGYRSSNNLEINTFNISDEVMFHTIPLATNENIMEALGTFVGEVSLKPISSKTTQDPAKSTNCLLLNDSWAVFHAFLSSTGQKLSEKMALDAHATELIPQIETSPDVSFILKNNPDLATQVHKHVRNWYQKIEMEIKAANSIRRVSPDEGPRTELYYWSAMVTNFTTQHDFMSSPPVRLFLKVLHGVDPVVDYKRPPCVKNWERLYQSVKAMMFEAKDILKYLEILDCQFQDLYIVTPESLPVCLKSLAYSMGLMYDASKYYNTPERGRVLPVLVTNQVIIALRNFLTSNGTLPLWSFPKHEVIEKTKLCLEISKQYRSSFEEAGRRISQPNEMLWISSSKGDALTAFCARLEKIQQALQFYIDLSVMHGSGLQGADVIMKKLNNALRALVNQTDHPTQLNNQFDTCFKAYEKEICSIQKDIEELIASLLTDCKHVSSALDMLGRLRNLKLTCVCLNTEYYRQLLGFRKEMDDLLYLYNVSRNNPPIERLSPPMAGKIRWVRNLMSKIEEPMKIFQSLDEVITRDGAKIVIRQYNSMVKLFLRYELQIHKAWIDELHKIPNMMAAPVLVHERTGRLAVNACLLDEAVLETEGMNMLGLEVPLEAVALQRKHSDLLKVRSKLQHLVGRYNEFRRTIPLLYLPLMKNSLARLDSTVDPGLVQISWSSSLLELFCDELEKALTDLNNFMDNIRSTREFGFESRMEELSQMVLLTLPEEEPMLVTDLVRTNLAAKDRRVAQLSNIIRCAETAVVEIITEFADKFDVPEAEERKHFWLSPEKLNQTVDSIDEIVPDDKAFMRCIKPTAADLPLFHRDAMRVYSSFFRRLLEALRAAVLQTINALSSRLKNADGLTPLLRVNLMFRLGSIEASPSQEDLEEQMESLTEHTLTMLDNLFMWGHREENIAPEVRDYEIRISYYEILSSDADITHKLSQLMGTIGLYSTPINVQIQSFEKYRYLWQKDVNLEVEKFSDYEIEMQVNLFYDYGKQVDDLRDSCLFASLLIDCRLAKKELGEFATHWKNYLCAEVFTLVSKEMDDTLEFIGVKEKVLDEAIKELSDIGPIISCLKDIFDNGHKYERLITKAERVISLLNAKQIDGISEATLTVDTLREKYERMLSKANSVSSTLVDIEKTLRPKLIENLRIFKEDEEEFHRDFDESGPKVSGLSGNEAAERVEKFASELNVLRFRLSQIQLDEALFGLPKSEFPRLEETDKEMRVLNRLYELRAQVQSKLAEYDEIPLAELDVESMESKLNEFQTKCKKLPKSFFSFPAYTELVHSVDGLKDLCPVYDLLAHPSLKERHWQRLEDLTGFKFPYESPTFCMKDMHDAPLQLHKDGVEDICVGAQKELDVEYKLRSVISEWQGEELTFASFKTRGELLLKGADAMELIARLEDSVMILSSLYTNRYNLPFKKEIYAWLKKLVKTSETLENWLLVQNLWHYLEAVFVSGDIARQLAAEAKRFAGIDKIWVRMMSSAQSEKVAVNVAGSETTAQTLSNLLEQLEVCQKSLTGYLETLRRAFPRFFFVSDPTLLEILGQASDCHTIQAHLLNIFENVFKVEFNEKVYDQVLGMLSKEMEYVKFAEPVSCTGAVEQWLSRLLIASHTAINDVIGEAAAKLTAPDLDIIDLLESFPAQIGLLAVQLKWTRDAESALKKGDPRVMRSTNAGFLALLNMLIDRTTGDLTKVERVKFETLVTIHVHQCDIFDKLTRTRVRSLTDFSWLKNMRFYWSEEKDETTVSVTDVDFVYQNEFMGCTERLVITPLTDRCYITLAQAIGMSMGGAPAGPAGTGKTETTKDMAKALGKYCVVFNCSDQMDFRGLGRIYKGLAQSGSWGCFDEFNRIELPVLSVAAQQISIILTARKERKSSFVFSDGDTVPLSPEVGMFITMNPGYAGRQELPENLKMLFRPIAMMVPDRQIIMRVKLAACGFKENINLASKFFTLYRLCEEQLSKQVHYDFGLRNILSVLRTLGARKRASPRDSEETTVMNVLRDMNVSKLVDEDEPLFTALVDDLFPGNKLKGSSQQELNKSISQACKNLNLINHPAWNLKIVQLYETSLVRHGLMVLGPTGAGKTTCTRALMSALTLQGTPHREMRMNPKAITAPQMFGRLDVATNDWTDGIFSTLWRRTLKVPPNECTWLVLDGPVDAVWIENLNSVLDDNKTLTLANGDRITMASNCKLVFEPDNVTNASPATISRMGMVFLSASVMPWSVILQGWLEVRPAHEASMLVPLFQKIFEDLSSFVTLKLNAKMSVAESHYVTQCCQILKSLLHHTPDTKSWSAKRWERLFLYSLMWSFGALLELKDRDLMESFVRGHVSKLNLPSKKDGYSMFEYLVDEVGTWQHWSARVEEYHYPEDSIPDYLGILVPNIDNVRTVHLIKSIAELGKPVLLIGEQGTAKTVIMKSYLSELNIQYHLSKIYNFSSATTPNMCQRIIESYVEKRVGTKYGPPGGRKMTVFIDDLSMPVVNEWGDQVTNELLRQLMEAGGFFSIDKPGDFSTMSDVQVVAAMIHPGGGRNDIPSRLKRQFVIINCCLPSSQSMDKIFSVIAEGYFCDSRFDPEVVSLASKLVPLTRVAWQAAKSTMLPTPAKFHYVFNLRDLSRIWQGILTVTRDGCTKPENLLELWRHECQRVISDRFVSEAEKVWFASKLKESAQQHIPALAETLGADNRYFADFLRDAPEVTGDEPEDFSLDPPKIYELVPSWEALAHKLTEYQLGYNESTRGMKLDLVFFQDAMRHLMIISRVIRMPRGSMLLVGVGGSGKQSLTKLASYIAGYRTFQVALTRAYNVNNFLEDLKVLYRLAGLQGQGVTFLFTENDIKDETFLEYLNNVLSAGEVANLFVKEEIEEIVNHLIPIMKKEYPRREPTMEALYAYFLTRAQSNLHVVLCFSPVGSKFRSRTLKFPGLISGTTIDWFQKWPRDGLVSVAKHVLLEFPIQCTDEVKLSLVDCMAEAHLLTGEACSKYYDRFRRLTHVTPKSFLSLLASYKNIYNEKLAHINMLNERMTAGVQKLIEAADGVDSLKKELVVMNELNVIASAEANKVLEEVVKEREATEKLKMKLYAEKDIAEALVTEIAQEKFKTESKLAAARPALAKAELALQTIKPADIATVRKLGKPPHLVTVIMDVVNILFQGKLNPIVYDKEHDLMTMSWDESLKMMADPRFLQRLTGFPKDKINAETVDLLRPYMKYKDYTFEKAKISSGNVAGLLQWTKAMLEFYHVNKDVLPMKANLAKQEKELKTAKHKLKLAQDELDAQQRQLDVVQMKFNEADAKKKAAKREKVACQSKMDKASSLINGLTGERQRWVEQLTQFKVQTDRLVGDVMLLSAFLCYSGPFNQEFREDLRMKWDRNLVLRKIPSTSYLNISATLTDPATVGEWNVFGLPSDDLSVENGILVSKAPRYPLLIDPQTQGKNWLMNMEKDNELQVTTLNDKYFRNHLEDCLSNGRPLIIEDAEEELDPVLDNILEKNYVKVGYSLKVKVGDKEVDIHSNFRLYITTKLPNPAFPPEVSARTAVIDFTVTQEGLEEQLLGRVIISEQNQLEEDRLNLIKGVTNNRREMEDLETSLLQKLSTSEGSLVDDESLVTMLNVSKDTAASLRIKLEQAVITEKRLNSAREVFRSVATRGSILYFLITDMARVNCMYQTSLAQFLERFELSLERSAKGSNQAKRILAIIDYLTYEVFSYTTRGLYVANRFMFALLLALKVDLKREAVHYHEFQFLIKGGAALDLLTFPRKTVSWIPDDTWFNIVQLSSIRPFQEILRNITENEVKWRLWFNREAPEMETPPKPFNDLPANKLLFLIRAWCPERIFSAGRRYIAQSLGSRFADPVILNMEAMVGESRPNTPILCLLSPGADPTPQVQRLARSKMISFRPISMGQGQEIYARKLMEHDMSEGGWVLLQNCHLGLDYMSEVALRVKDDQIHSDFRLFLTTDVHPSFPVSLLQMSIKYTNEAPQGRFFVIALYDKAWLGVRPRVHGQISRPINLLFTFRKARARSGIRAGLLRTYADLTEDTLELSDDIAYLPLLFTTSFFHAVVQERRKFGPLGWCIPYEFNGSDWIASVTFIRRHLDDLEKNASVSWPTIRYMIGEIQYGGRVTDDFDKRLLITMVRFWFNEEILEKTAELHVDYLVLKHKSISNYLKDLAKFPDPDPPQAVGLHPNANIAYQTKDMRDMMDGILAIQPKQGSSAGGTTLEQRVLTAVNDMIERLPHNYDPHEAGNRLREMGALTPMVIFLRQEIDRMRLVLNTVNDSLQDLVLAIQGSIIMNEELSDAMNSIDEARVPASWLRGSWSSSSLGLWFTELIERNDQFSKWLMKGRPKHFWMTGFFNPQGFLTAMRQEVARAHKGWALDSVVLDNTILRQSKEDTSKIPTEGVLVHGLFLDGAGWDKKKGVLVESSAKVLYVRMPLIHITAINSSLLTKKAKKSIQPYQCPVYKKPQRTDLTYVTTLALGTDKPQEHWIMRAVALLCDTKF